MSTAQTIRTFTAEPVDHWGAAPGALAQPTGEGS
jgi:hypothetical protein